MRAPVVAAMLLVAAPLALAEASSDAHARNVAFFWSLLHDACAHASWSSADACGGDADPAQPASLPDGRVVTLATAIDEAAARAGSVDLAAVAHGAGPSPRAPVAGAAWVIEVGRGPCATIVTPIHSPYNLAGDPQYWMWAGPLAQLSTTHGAYTQLIGWTTKQSSVDFETAGFTATGVSDLFCTTFGDLRLAFPFLDGEAHLNPAQAASAIRRA